MYELEHKIWGRIGAIDKNTNDLGQSWEWCIILGDR